MCVTLDAYQHFFAPTEKILVPVYLGQVNANDYDSLSDRGCDHGCLHLFYEHVNECEYEYAHGCGQYRRDCVHEYGYVDVREHAVVGLCLL